MNDLGFGMLDKRSVAAILFSLGLAAALGLKIPIDTSNVVNLFAGVVLFTGALYAFRSLFRLIAISIFAISKGFRYRLRKGFFGDGPKWVGGGQRELLLLKMSWYIFDYPYYYSNLASTRDEDNAYLNNPRKIVRFLDRLFLVGVVFAACLPTTTQYINVFGILGVSIMLLIYIVRGGFTFVVKDAIDAADESEENRAKMTAQELNRGQSREGSSIGRFR